METRKRRMLIVDCTDESSPNASPAVNKASIQPLPEEFGRNLDTIPRARQWLTNPHNWHTSQMYIVRWNGLLCTVNEKHARELIDNPNDNGLPEVIVREQIRLKRGGKQEHDEMEAEE